MAKDKKNGESALVKRADESLEPMPKWVTEVEPGSGYEGGSAEDIRMPVLTICQSMSPQRHKSKPEYIDGLEEGDLFNDVTGEVYAQPVRITAIAMRKSRVKWNDPDQINSGIACFGRPTDDPANLEGIACQLNNGGACLNPGFDKASCRKVMNFPVVVHGDKSVVLLRMKSTGIKVGRVWFTTMRYYKVGGRTVPMMAQQFDLSTVVQPNPKGTSFQYKVTRVAGFPSEEVGRAALEAYDGMKRREFRDVDATAAATAAKDREPGDEGDEI